MRSHIDWARLGLVLAVLAIPLACKQVGSVRPSSNNNTVPNSNRAPTTARATRAQMDVCALVTNADAESILIKKS